MPRRAKRKDILPERRPELTPEARENRMIALAVNQAEKQLMEGTASSQVLVHYLRLASSKADLEKKLLEKQNELMAAKTQALKSAARQEELYLKAIEAMRAYSGNGKFHENSDL